MGKASTDDFRYKEVINICDGKRLGLIDELEFNLSDGKITAIILPGEGGFCGFGGSDPVVVPWERIERIGEDVILVNAQGCFPPPRAKRKR